MQDSLTTYRMMLAVDAMVDPTCRSMKVRVPEGKAGDWKVERFTITEQVAFAVSLRASRGDNFGRGFTPAGSYTRLVHGNTMVMSDTQDECLDHKALIQRAEGRVLIAGLGLGVSVQGCLRNPKVDRVTVLEKSPEVIKLVAPYYYEQFGPRRFDVIEADVFDWKWGELDRWDVVWFDIWNSLSTSNVAEMTKLKRRFARRAGWQGCWAEETCRVARRAGL